MNQAPLKASVRARLKKDALDVVGTAARKGLDLDQYEAFEEQSVANTYFELGCWLHYYQNRFRHDGGTLSERVDCVEKIFLAGHHRIGYKFFTVFDFGERQFDSIFEQGDWNEVVMALRQRLPFDTTGRMEEAFRFYGWPTSLSPYFIWSNDERAGEATDRNEAMRLADGYATEGSDTKVLNERNEIVYIGRSSWQKKLDRIEEAVAVAQSPSASSQMVLDGSELTEGNSDWRVLLRDNAEVLLELAKFVDEGREVISALAGDAEDAGYPGRADSARVVASRMLEALKKLGQ